MTNMSAPDQCLNQARKFGNEGRIDKQRSPGLRSRAQLINQGVQAMSIFPELPIACLALQGMFAVGGAAVLKPRIVAAPVEAVARGDWFIRHN